MTVIDNFLEILNSVPKDINLVAVSKRQDISKISLLVDYCKLNNIDLMLAENYVQEAEDKYKEIDVSFKLHLIGDLQSNKVSRAVRLFDCIQTVSREKILKLIDKEAKKINKIQDIMIQVNISNDSNKKGILIQEVKEFYDMSKKFENVKLKGFMGVTFNSQNNQKLLEEFDLFSKTINQIDPSLIKSIGMSSDYKLAIKSGSNMIRIGSLIFGDRIK